jgi:hypothetical protein
MPVISIPKPLREKLGEEASNSLVVMLNQYEEKSRESMIALAEKQFEQKLASELSIFREAMVWSDLSLKEELKEDIHKHSVNTIKWMFIFWIGQIGALLGILLVVFK